MDCITDIKIERMICSKIAYCGPNSSNIVKFEINIKEIEEKEKRWLFNNKGI